jgi:hypothetical protein
MKKTTAAFILLIWSLIFCANSQELPAADAANPPVSGTHKKHAPVDNHSDDWVGVAHGFPFECEEAASYLRQNGVKAGAEGSIGYCIAVPPAQGRRAIRLLNHRYRDTHEFHIERQPWILP